MLGDEGRWFQPCSQPLTASGVPQVLDVNRRWQARLGFPYRAQQFYLGNGRWNCSDRFHSYSRNPLTMPPYVPFGDMDGDGHADAVCGYPSTITGDFDRIHASGSFCMETWTVPSVRRPFPTRSSGISITSSMVKASSLRNPILIADLNLGLHPGHYCLRQRWPDRFARSARIHLQRSGALCCRVRHQHTWRAFAAFQRRLSM